ncbi:MAG TPA: hypothetical protein VFH95_09995 [Candidatus Kapabacteria bacterium]|nr:hypothetical protein [Candidatus Kapabacteria bacterium]
MPRKLTSRSSAVAMKAVPKRRTLVLLETGLILGLVEGIMTDAITHLNYSPYLKALMLMVGVIGAFALAIRVLEPVVRQSLKIISKVDSGRGALTRIGLHIVILFIIFAGYVRIFFSALK